MTPTEFVLARIADREAVARAATPGPWRSENHAGAGAVYSDAPLDILPKRNVTWPEGYQRSIANESAWGDVRIQDADHIALNDPTAVLARCAVHRRILEEHETIRARYAGSTIEDDPCCKTCSGYGDDPGEYPCATVALLASLDADHPDYDKSWWPL